MVERTEENASSGTIKVKNGIVFLADEKITTLLNSIGEVGGKP